VIVGIGVCSGDSGGGMAFESIEHGRKNGIFKDWSALEYRAQYSGCPRAETILMRPSPEYPNMRSGSRNIERNFPKK
jgi:hypothetical protein